MLDVSRSMLAAAHPLAQTRLDRAVDYAGRLRAELAEIPLGVAWLTDRPLPHLFPTADREIFAAVLTEAVGIEKPPPAETGLVRATTFGSLRRLATGNYFTAQSSKRAAIVLTDGESRSVEIEALAAELREEVISLFVVRFWSVDEGVWEPDGTPEPYRPDPPVGCCSRVSGPTWARRSSMSTSRPRSSPPCAGGSARGRSWSLEQTRRPSRSPPESRCSLRCRSRSCSSAGPAERQRFGCAQPSA